VNTQGILVLLVIAAHAAASDAETAVQWTSPTEQPATDGAELLALGRLQFSDGETGLWLGTTTDNWRRVGRSWERWPDGLESGAGIRDALLAPGPDGTTHWWLATEQGLLISDDDRNWRPAIEPDSWLADHAPQALHLSQDQAGRPVVWLGTDQGLIRNREGAWHTVAARSDGFHGGPIKRMIGIDVQNRHQVWVAGPRGLSMESAGHWHRPARDCLRDHVVNDIHDIVHPQGDRIAVATDQALFLIDPAEPDACHELISPRIPGQPVVRLGTDRGEQLYLMRHDGIERVRFDPVRRQPRWQWFNHRDGLPAAPEWVGAAGIDDNQILIASRTGLWTPQSDTSTDTEGESINLILRLDGTSQSIAPGEVLDVRETSIPITIQPRGFHRQHVLLYRHTTDHSSEWSQWQTSTSINIDFDGYGGHEVRVEVLNERGAVQGPWEFGFNRTFPIGWIVMIVSVIALLTIAATMVLQMRR